uniref:thiol oxidase n=1 Tax=viral metagenome TaxID=1070528 RepID=A0A6C0DCI8_9ZZZZ
MHFDPSVWGPHYWFFIHTVSESYPKNPNDVTKRKYYDFIQNIPLFIPVPEMGDKFSRLLDKYPVTPYLDNRDSFVRWTHFIHNKYNVMLGKPEIPLPLALEMYRDQYKPKPIYLADKIKMRKHYLIMAIILILLGLIIIYYNQ